MRHFPMNVTAGLSQNSCAIAQPHTSNSSDTSVAKTVLHLGPSLSQQGGMATVQTLLMTMNIEGFRLVHIPTHDEGSVHHRLTIFAGTLWRTLQAIWCDRTFEIGHCHMSERGSVGRVLILCALLSLGRKRIVIHTHGAEFREFYEGQPAVVQHLIRIGLNRCHRLIVLSESWRDYYAKAIGIAPERISVFHNPVQIPASPTSTAAQCRPFHLLFLGRIGERKGAFTLIRAFAAFLHQSSQPAHLTLAGDGKIEEARQLATELGIAEFVSLPGWVDAPTVQTLLADADAFILPSLNEGLPMAILEAMSWGLPVIASAVGGIPEVIIPRQTGLLIDPQDLASITHAIAQLAEHPAFAQTLGQAARTYAENCSSQNYQAKLTKLYNTLLTQR